MTENNNAHDADLDWWENLGLSAPRASGDSANDRRRLEAHLEVLRGFPPLAFTSTSPDVPDRQIQIVDVAAESSAAQARVEREIIEEAQARSGKGWAEIRAAFAAPDADELVTHGDWIGFSRARAIAWCWNLYQFEPQGFISPGSQLRRQRVRELEAGSIPNGFGYADRARELEAEGLTPQQYRSAREALGSPTFTPADIRG